MFISIRLHNKQTTPAIQKIYKSENKQGILADNGTHHYENINARRPTGCQLFYLQPHHAVIIRASNTCTRSSSVSRVPGRLARDSMGAGLFKINIFYNNIGSLLFICLPQRFCDSKVIFSADHSHLVGTFWLFFYHLENIVKLF